jgi:hypothetical protein
MKKRLIQNRKFSLNFNASPPPGLREEDVGKVRIARCIIT